MAIRSKEISADLALLWSEFNAANPHSPHPASTTPASAQLTIADLDYPWQHAKNGHMAQADALCWEWVRASGIIRCEQMQQRYDHISGAALAAWCYPHAPLNRLALLAKLIAWVFLEDDVYDNGEIVHDPRQMAQTFALYADILNGQVDGSNGSVTARALGQLRAELADLMPLPWMNRFCAAMEDFWFRGVLCESQLREAQHIPTMDDYMKMRVYSVAVAPVIQLIEFAGDFVLPEALIFERQMQQLTWLTTRIVIYTNDIFSYEKERKLQDPNNYMYLLMHHEKLDFNQALDHAIRAHQADVQALQALIATLPTHGPELAAQVQSYIEGHCAWIYGALVWQRTSKRYHAGKMPLYEI